MPSILRKRFYPQTLLVFILELVIGLLIIFLTILAPARSGFFTISESILFMMVMVCLINFAFFMVYVRFVNKLFFKRVINFLQFASAILFVSTIIIWFVKADWKNAESIVTFLGFMLASMTYVKSELKIVTDKNDLGGILQLFSYDDEYVDIIGALGTKNFELLDNIYERTVASPEKHADLLQKLRDIRHASYDDIFRDHGLEEFLGSLTESKKNELYSKLDIFLKGNWKQIQSIGRNEVHAILFEDIGTESIATKSVGIIPPEL